MGRLNAIKFRIGLALMAVLCCSAPTLGQSQGDTRFPTGVNGTAGEYFQQGIQQLHQFNWSQARLLFQQAQDAAPTFAMAYWAEALTYNSPLGSELDIQSPMSVLEKLAPSTDARLSLTSTALEQGFLQALESFLSAEGNLLRRRQVYLEHLSHLYESYFGEPEVNAFYALALLSVAAMSSDSSRHELHQIAGGVSLKLFSEHPDHVGAALYTVLAHDEPGQVQIALPAVKRLRSLETPSAYIRHVTSRMSVYLGQWYEAAEINEMAFFAARASWQSGLPLDPQLEALEWGQYADLQLADLNKARDWIQHAKDTVNQNPHSRSARLTLQRMQARYLIESQEWITSTVTPDNSADELLAIGLGAIAARDLALARSANQLLKTQISRQPTDEFLHLTQLTLEGGLQFATNREIDSRKAFDEAIALMDKLGPFYGLPYPMKPALELYGATLLRSGKPAQAAEIFRSSLEYAPFRPESLLGLARCHVALGEPFLANQYYQMVLDTWDDRKMLGSSEAKTHLSIYGEPSPPTISADSFQP